MTPRWYTVEYDENGIAWLIADDKDRVCLEHGMQVEVSTLAMQRPIGDEQAQTETPARPRRARIKRQGV
jgi:hypothetical protein